MTPPRQIEKGQTSFLSVRAVGRSFRFVPKRRVNETIWYVLAVVLDAFRDKIAVHDFFFMSNHYHVVLTDNEGVLPELMERLDSLLTRALNALRGISGTGIEKGYNRVVVTGDKVIEHCVYTLTNACAAHLVARSRHWKGVSSLKLDYGVPITIERPNYGMWSGKAAHAQSAASRRSKRAEYAGRSKLPQRVELVLTRPAVMPHLSDAELRAYIRKLVDERELELIAERKAKGIRVVSWDRVVQQSFLAIPGTEERFGRVPSFSAENAEKRVAAAKHRKAFLGAYYAALKAYVSGALDVLFPEGTWLMKRRFGVPCCPLPDS